MLALLTSKLWLKMLLIASLHLVLGTFLSVRFRLTDAQLLYDYDRTDQGFSKDMVIHFSRITTTIGMFAAFILSIVYIQTPELKIVRIGLIVAVAELVVFLTLFITFIKEISGRKGIPYRGKVSLSLIFHLIFIVLQIVVFATEIHNTFGLSYSHLIR